MNLLKDIGMEQN